MRPSHLPFVSRGSLLAFLSLALFAATSARADESESNLEIKIYGDANYAFSTTNIANPEATAAKAHSSFAAGLLDIFPSYQLDRVTFLSEVVFEGGTGGTENIGVDVERMQVAYLVKDWLRLRVGRSHTAFGYYGDVFHHAREFDLTTNRPYFIQFEDSGGLLVAHTTGVGADGTLKSKVTDVRYDLDVGNGRTSDPTAVALYYSPRTAPMMNLRLRLLPHFLDGLMVGGNVMYVPIAASPTPDPLGVPVLAHNLNEYDVGAHAAYMEHHLHLILEGAILLREDAVTSARYRHYIGYFEGGYSIGAFTPYGRIEGGKLDSADPYLQNQSFTATAFTGSWADTRYFADGRLGIKWIATENIAIKVEYRHFVTNGAAGGLPASGLPSFDGGQAQFAFGF
jgi:hypothetical protein